MPNAATAVLEPAGAVFLSAEDDTEDTIQPRLALAGADLDKIAVRKVGDLVMLTIADLDVIRGAVKLVDAKLVVIDPLMAFLPAETPASSRIPMAPSASIPAQAATSVSTWGRSRSAQHDWQAGRQRPARARSEGSRRHEERYEG